MAAHTFNTNFIVYYLGFFVYGLDRATLHTHLAVLTKLAADSWPSLQKIYDSY